MQPLLLRSTLVIAIVLNAATANLASAQTPQTSPDLKARCDQLISYYDRYGAGRSENSDGARNHTRIGAGIDCENGHYAEGVTSMEALLKQKSFDVPPPPTGLAQTPAPLKPHGELRHNSQ
jgi:hypothetical protein